MIELMQMTVGLMFIGVIYKFYLLIFNTQNIRPEQVEHIENKVLEAILDRLNIKEKPIVVSRTKSLPKAKKQLLITDGVKKKVKKKSG